MFTVKSGWYIVYIKMSQLYNFHLTIRYVLNCVLCLSLFCYALLCAHSSFVIILKSKKKLIALLLLSYRCIVAINVLWPFFVVT